MIVQYEEILPSPEDVISTGTTGVVEIRSGDAVSCCIEGFELLSNPVEPGISSTAIDTSRAEALHVSVEEVRGQVEAQIPLGRYGTPEEFAGVAVFVSASTSHRSTAESITALMR